MWCDSDCTAISFKWFCSFKRQVVWSFCWNAHCMLHMLIFSLSCSCVVVIIFFKHFGVKCLALAADVKWCAHHWRSYLCKHYRRQSCVILSGLMITINHQTPLFSLTVILHAALSIQRTNNGAYMCHIFWGVPSVLSLCDCGWMCQREWRTNLV